MHQAVWDYTRRSWLRIALVASVTVNFLLSFWTDKPYKYLELFSMLVLIALQAWLETYFSYKAENQDIRAATKKHVVRVVRSGRYKLE